VLAGIIHRLLQLKQSPVGEGAAQVPPLEPGGQQSRLDVGVSGAIDPVAEIGIAQSLPAQLDDAGLGGLLNLAYLAHGFRYQLR